MGRQSLDYNAVSKMSFVETPPEELKFRVLLFFHCSFEPSPRRHESAELYHVNILSITIVAKSSSDCAKKAAQYNDSSTEKQLLASNKGTCLCGRLLKGVLRAGSRETRAACNLEYSIRTLHKNLLENFDQDQNLPGPPLTAV
jgi:hypothetical protein